MGVGAFRELVTKLDSEKGISDNPLLSDSKAESKAESVPDDKASGASPKAAEAAVPMDTAEAASSDTRSDPIKLVCFVTLPAAIWDPALFLVYCTCMWRLAFKVLDLLCAAYASRLAYLMRANLLHCYEV